MTRKEKRAIVAEAMDRYHEYLCEGPVGDPERFQKADQDYWIRQVMAERGATNDDVVFVLGYQPRPTT